MLLDAHTHLDMYEPDELEAALAQLEAQRITSWSMSVDPDTYERNLAIATRSPWVLTSFGIHPWWAPQFADKLEELEPLLLESPHYGEIGLDYAFVEDTAAYPDQHKVFAFFLAAAVRHDRIINLHTSGAEADIAAAIRTHGIRRAVVHWYSGPEAPFAEMKALGCYFTIGVEVLSSARIREIAREIPLDRLLSETDSPSGMKWVTGERGMPAHVAKVVAELAALREMEPAALEARVWENFKRLMEGAWPDAPTRTAGQA